MKIIANAMPKGGAGKSSTSRHWAVQAAHSGLRTSIVDHDAPQWTSARWYDRRRHAHPTLPYPVVAKSDGANLASVVDARRQAGDELCFIDCAPTRGAAPASAIEIADLVVLVMKASLDDLDSFEAAWPSLRTFQKPVTIVFNQVSPFTSRGFEEAIGLFDGLDVSIAPTAIRTREAFGHAVNAGLGVTELEPNGKAAGEIAETLTHLLKQVSLEPGAN